MTFLFNTLRQRCPYLHNRWVKGVPLSCGVQANRLGGRLHALRKPRMAYSVQDLMPWLPSLPYLVGPAVLREARAVGYGSCAVVESF
jgi:hypothetical protein